MVRLYGLVHYIRGIKYQKLVAHVHQIRLDEVSFSFSCIFAIRPHTPIIYMSYKMRNCHLPRNRKVQLLISCVLFLAVAYNIYDHTLNRFVDMPDATHFSSGISTTGRREYSQCT
jgi:hypothetical protein